MVLVMENAVPPTKDVAARIAADTLAKRGPTRTRSGASSTPPSPSWASTAPRRGVRVADIVAAAGVSNDTFYRHFSSKDALVVALLEDGTERLASYIAHQMSKESTAERQVRRWVEGVLSQTREEAASTTLAVLWNGSSIGTGVTAGRHNAGAPLAALLHEPFAALGSADPELDSSLVAHATLGKVADYLWAHARPSRAETEHIARFCIGVATP